MPRSKYTKSHSKPASNATAAIPVTSVPVPLVPLALSPNKNMTPVPDLASTVPEAQLAVEERPKRTRRRHKAKVSQEFDGSVEGHEEEKHVQKHEKKHEEKTPKEPEEQEERAPIVPPKAPSRNTKAQKKSGVTIASPTVNGNHNSLKDIGYAVDEISAVLSLSRRLPLPGVFAPSVDMARAMRVVITMATASAALSFAGRSIIDWLARTPLMSLFASSSMWVAWAAYVRTTATPGICSLIVALGIRIMKLSFAWGALSNLVALNVLVYGPIVYLLSSFYNVPLSAIIVSEGLNFVTDMIPLAMWRYLSGTTEQDYVVGVFRTMKRTSSANELHQDSSTFVYSLLLAATLYGFTFVQACRIFLPATFVVHFFGIATVEPARLLELSPHSMPTVSELASAIFLSSPAVLLNLVCGTASRVYIFGTLMVASPLSGASAPHGDTGVYRKAIVLRTVALSLAVGLSVFSQCLQGIAGVDAVGAAAFASIWTAAPLMTGFGLGLAGV